MNLYLYEEHARELVSMPKEWRICVIKALRGSVVDAPTGITQVDGVVCPDITRGKNKGLPNWAKRDKSTERAVYITDTQHAAWCKAWSEKTGKCVECVGRGQIMASWHHINGTTYKPCSACAGTGEV